SLAFTYDDNGNRTNKFTGTFSTTIDANGNPIVTPVAVTAVTPYYYGIRDELLKTVDDNGIRETFDYDHNRMRVKRNFGAAGTRYLYDDNATLLEYSSQSLFSIPVGTQAVPGQPPVSDESILDSGKVADDLRLAFAANSTALSPPD